MLDRLLRMTFKNFSTFFLLVFIVTGPLHCAYAFAFRNVIATSELHSDIRGFPNYRQVRSVGPPTLTQAAIGFWIVTGVELLLIPLAAAATRRAVEVDRGGGVPTAVDSWRHAPAVLREPSPPGSRPWGVVLAGLVVAISVGFLVEKIAIYLAELTSEDLRWLAVGAGQAVSRAVGAPFLLVPLGMARSAKATTPQTPKLY